MTQQEEKFITPGCQTSILLLKCPLEKAPNPYWIHGCCSLAEAETQNVPEGIPEGSRVSFSCGLLQDDPSLPQITSPDLQREFM